MVVPHSISRFGVGNRGIRKENDSKFRFDAKLPWFGFVSFQINFLIEEFRFVSN